MILYLVSLISGFNFLVLSLVLFLKESPFKHRNRYLAFAFLFSGIYEAMNSYFTYFIIHNQSYLQYYVSIEVILIALCGPLLYFYTLSITIGKVNFNLKSLNHILPILPLIAVETKIGLLPPEDRIDYLIGNYRDLQLEVAIENIWLLSLLIFYFTISLRKIITFRKQLKPEKLGKYNNDTGWFRKYIILILSLIVISLPIGALFNDDKAYIIIGQIIMNIQFIYIFINILWSSHLFPADKKSTFWGNDKYAGSNLSKNQLNSYLNKVIDYLETEKLYTKTDLTINQLANKLEIPAHCLSQVINAEEGLNFFDFINKFRVNDAKKLLLSDKFKNYTIESIAHECGFGAKSSFNKAFKKFTGKTPSEYRKEI